MQYISYFYTNGKPANGLPLLLKKQQPKNNPKKLSFTQKKELTLS